MSGNAAEMAKNVRKFFWICWNKNL